MNRNMKKKDPGKVTFGRSVLIIICAMLVTGSGWWSDCILSYFGESLRLVRNGRMTREGFCATLLVFLVAVCVVSVQGLRRLKGEKKIRFLNKRLENRRQYNDFLYSEVAKLYEYRTANKVPLLDSRSRNVDSLFRFTEEQLKRIQEAVKSCTKKCLDIAGGEVDRDLYVSILYRFPDSSENGWHWTPQAERRGANANDLMKNKSVFTKLLQDDVPYVIYNSKKKAHKEGWYYRDNSDLKEDMCGSIACFKLELKSDDTVKMIALVGVSTYHHPFVPEKSGISEDDVARLLKRDVIDVFGPQLKLEICNLKIRQMRARDN